MAPACSAIQALAQDNVRTLFEQLKQQYDFIIIDAPPVLPVTDTLLLGQHVDGVLFAVLDRVRIGATCLALLILIGLVLLAAPVRAAVPGFDSAYAGESAFLTIGPGMSGQFQVFFTNTGSTTWRKGTTSQVNLTVCLDDKRTYKVDSPLASGTTAAGSRTAPTARTSRQRSPPANWRRSCTASRSRSQ